MKSKQVLEMTDKELQNKLNELKSELFFLRFKNATNQLTNPMVLVETRRDIARVKTVIRQREIARAKEDESKKG
ncbi:MAG: 50S ribosomal protein L29 [Christensenellales bacterium]|jgi:ribosomal protein L29|nr:50S ribosomal protein L29 [Christensenellales bacterium]